jgi:hypothetical protein
MTVMIAWLVFLHVGAVIAFALGHGVQISVMWRQRQEADPARNLAFFEVLPSSTPLRILAAAVVLSGLALTAALSAWGRGWIWLSLSIFAGVWIAMWRFGGAYYSAIEAAGAQALEARGTSSEADATAAWNRARLGPEPVVLAIVGLGGLAVILWLMVFKPF